jgi:hypothetical protein
MNIDQRLEALTQSVELLAAMHKDTMLGVEKLRKADSRLEKLVTEIAEGTARLLHAVESHEQRIADLEGNRPQ